MVGTPYVEPMAFFQVVVGAPCSGEFSDLQAPIVA